DVVPALRVGPQRDGVGHRGARAGREGAGDRDPVTRAGGREGAGGDGLGGDVRVVDDVAEVVDGVDGRGGAPVVLEVEGVGEGRPGRDRRGARPDLLPLDEAGAGRLGDVAAGGAGGDVV